MKDYRVAIVGSGNIGTDLMYKIERTPELSLAAMVGIDPQSDGLARARSKGYRVLDTGVEGLEPFLDDFDLVMEATSAGAHLKNSVLYRQWGKTAIDLTPAAIGPYVVPVVNLDQLVDEDNVNMITCGGQATIPIVAAISRVTTVNYAEIVATISSRSAGPGTRANIDEFTHTTAQGIEKVGGALKGKAIIVLNPAKPYLIMRDTVYVEVEEVKETEILESLKEMEADVRSYVPGYRLKTDPVFEGNKVTVFLEVEGSGDYLPPFAGNLDIMTAAATRVAQVYAAKR
ncbi:acetaldehyde dehydrogenase [Ferrithrix thermotolerans DSM 19514]|uniref:Acetaldehyde dehydrogenase n=1 Tax=Ferrithrix thermotolerans DSM 19514 TaxID=1121881 RepID=A0A1M4V222_9ACTN|nr:acetaldehyde dehydrogenase (acetylating) [Ferrithrix thermotolerans]SHE63005.1 acetaldehyde dehydrogenase [Ferrithrix thermotolerans DSM 19514]